MEATGIKLAEFARMSEAERAEYMRRLMERHKTKKGNKKTSLPVDDANIGRFLNSLLTNRRTALKATILTAADKGYFVALQCLVVSLRLSHDCTIRIVDLGLTAKQVAWCRRQGCEVVKPGKLIVPKSQFFWQTWNKSLYIADVKGPSIWLDADCIVTGSLSAMDDLLLDRPVIFTDTAAPHFNGWHDGTTSTANEPELYRDYQTDHRFARGDCPNAGVLAFDPQRPRDKAIIDTWTWMIRQSVKDKRLAPPPNATHQCLHGLLRWHDQGALQWALEKLNECDLVLSDQRFNDPISATGAKSLDELTTKLEELRQTRVAHFPCGSKPYHTFPKSFDPDVRGYPANRKDLALFVLGHDRQRLKKITGPCLKRIYLPDIDPDNDLAESRIFATNILQNCDTEFIGLCTQRWDEKYHHCRPLTELHRLPLRMNVVWAAATADSWWLDYTEQAHPGMRKLVEVIADKMGVKNLRARSVWSNNFIAHHGTVKDLQAWVWRGLGIARAEFGAWPPKYGMKGADKSRVGSYLAERMSMLYFCMREDLDIRQIPL